MGIFGNIFGGGESAPNQENQSVNPVEGVDLLNNVTTGEQAIAENPDMAQQPQAETQSPDSSEAPASEVAPAPAEASIANEATAIPDSDVEDVATNVNQQLAQAGIELGDNVVVQPEVAPVSDAEATEDVSAISAVTPAAESVAPAPEQLAQADNDTPEAV